MHNPGEGGRGKLGLMLGSGCGAVGRAVASDTSDPWFQSSHPQKFYLPIVEKKIQK